MKSSRKPSPKPSKKPSKKAPKKPAAKPLTASQQLEALIAKLEKKQQVLFRSVRNFLRRRFASSDEMVYAYSHSLVIAYSPTGKGQESPVSIATRDGGVRLYFNNSVKLPDPKKLLLGSAKQVRYLWVESPKTLLLPEVQEFMKAAVDLAKAPDRPDGRGKLIIK